MRVVIGEDEALLREGLAMLLEREGVDVVAAVGDAGSLLHETMAQQPDLVITDIRMPPHHTDDGLLAAVQLRQSTPQIGVIVLSQHVVRRYALQLIGDRPNGVGYLLKHRIGDVASFVQDLNRVADGGTVLDPDVVAVMVSRSARDNTSVERLTPRQRQVLGLIAEGRSNAAIAKALGITEKAVARHASSIYDVLGLAASLDDHRRVLAVIRLLSL
jgi:DNA-binding NarL/FixJ family response regulator